MKKISIEIDDNLYQVLLNSSAKSMRSFRKQIVFDLIEVYKEEIAKLPASIIERNIEHKHNQITVSTNKNIDNPVDILCKSCGVQVSVSPRIHEANARLCKDCKKQKFADE